MNYLVLAGLGGFLGTAARYGVGAWVAQARGGGHFPMATTIVNVTGCLAIGFLAGLGETRGVFTPAARAFLFAGVLGGYTTFSTLGYETFRLLREGHFGLAALSAGTQVVLGLAAVWAGDAAARAL